MFIRCHYFLLLFTKSLKYLFTGWAAYLELMVQMLYILFIVTLGISASRWRLLRRPIIASQERAQWLIKAMCLLHNYLQVHKDQNYCSPGLADSVAEDGSITDGFWRAAQSPLQDLTTSSRKTNTEGFNIRESLKDYFIGPGNVAWQHQHVNRRKIYQFHTFVVY